MSGYRRVIVLLLAVGLALAAGLGVRIVESRALLVQRVLQWGEPMEVVSPPVTIARPEFSLRPKGEYREVIERPLFSPMRRPAQPHDGKSFPAGEQGIALLGVIHTPETERALLRLVETGKVLRLRQGEEVVAGWHLESIAPDGVVLRRGADAQMIPLRDYHGTDTRPEASPQDRGVKSPIN